MKIGVLALQGGFAEHLAALADFPEAEGVAIRRRADFTSDVAGLIIPGGESTVLSKLLVDLHLLEPVRAAVQGGLPVFGTCAGLILLAREVAASAAPRIGLLDVAVARNSYGRQLGSFATRAPFADTGEMDMVFIRAPGILRRGAGVRSLAVVDGRDVAVQQGNILATAFHPELTDDRRVHRYFLAMAAAPARG